MLLVLVAAMPWEGDLNFPTHTLTVVKGLGLLLILSYGLRAVVTRESGVTAPALAPAAALACALIFALLVSPAPTEGVLTTVRYLLYIVFLFLMVQLLRDRDDIVRVMGVFVLSAAAAAVVGSAGVLSGALQRATGPITDPNDFGYLLATAIPLALYLGWRARRHAWVWWLATLLLLAGTLATFSRGALASLAAVLLWAVLTRRLPLGAVLAAIAVPVLVVAVAFALFGSTLADPLAAKSSIASRNVSSREAFWVASFQMFADHPLLGIGPDRLADELPSYVRNDPVPLDQGNGHVLAVHNSYLEILVEEGPLALLAFLALLVVLWVGLDRTDARFRRGADADGRRLVDAVRAGLIAAIVGAVVISIQTGTPFWLLGGLASAMYASDGVLRAYSTPSAPAAARDVRRLPIHAGGGMAGRRRSATQVMKSSPSSAPAARATSLPLR
jgi:O-antigen ligase